MGKKDGMYKVSHTCRYVTAPRAKATGFPLCLVGTFSAQAVRQSLGTELEFNILLVLEPV